MYVQYVCGYHSEISASLPLCSAVAIREVHTICGVVLFTVGDTLEKLVINILFN